MGKLMDLMLGLLAVAIVVAGYLFYKASQNASASVSSAAASTSNINALAGDVDSMLKSFGVNGPAS